MFRMACLRHLMDDPVWHDPSDDLFDQERPIDLRFPGQPGWGEGLLIASLLKRIAAKEKRSVPVTGNQQVDSILQHDPCFEFRATVDGRLRPPTAVLRQALSGDLLEAPFQPISGWERPSNADAIGFAWASISQQGRPIAEKSTP